MHWQKRPLLRWIVIAATMYCAFTSAARRPPNDAAPRSIDQSNSSSPIDSLLETAQRFFEAGRYDLADKRFRQVLALDPDNDAAAWGRAQVSAARERLAKRKIETGESEFTLPASPPPVPEPRLDPSLIHHKLENISIPFFEVYAMTLKDVLELLRREAVKYDADADARGIKILLQPEGLYKWLQNWEDRQIPSLPPGADQPANNPSAKAYPTGETRLNLTVAHASLGDVLDRVAAAVSLKVKIGPRSVALVPLVQSVEQMATMELRIPPSFIGVDSAPAPSPSTLDTIGYSGPSSLRLDAKKFLEGCGMTFPPGSSAVYLRSTSKLVIRNTQANLDLLTGLAGEYKQSNRIPTPPP